MNAHFTSFWKARGHVVSSARWQPKQFNFPEATWMQPLDEQGIVGIRRFDGDVQAYYQGLIALYRSRHVEVTAWVKAHDGENITIACWCPHTKAAKRQLEQFGTFVCHTLAVARVLQQYGWTVELDEDRTHRCVQIEEA